MKRDDSTRLRSRKGQYVAECAFCECPDGCACDGHGCPCGTTKAPKKSRAKKSVAHV